MSEWIEMPVSFGQSPDARAQPKHAIVGSAVLVYRGERVYAALEDRAALERLAELPDVRRLAPDEVISFEATLPGTGTVGGTASAGSGREADGGRTGLGDVVGWFTRALGVQECGGCSQRKQWLNRVTVRRARIARGN